MTMRQQPVSKPDDAWRRSFLTRHLTRDTVGVLDGGECKRDAGHDGLVLTDVQFLVEERHEQPVGGEHQLGDDRTCDPSDARDVGNGQDQKGSAGKLDQSQTGSNENQAQQSADSSADNQQSNENASFPGQGDGWQQGNGGCSDEPPALYGQDGGSPGGGDGDGGGKVDQSNEAWTGSQAGNANSTDQGNGQSQEGSVS